MSTLADLRAKLVTDLTSAGLAATVDPTAVRLTPGGAVVHPVQSFERVGLAELIVTGEVTVMVELVHQPPATAQAWAWLETWLPPAMAATGATTATAALSERWSSDETPCACYQLAVGVSVEIDTTPPEPPGETSDLDAALQALDSLDLHPDLEVP